MGHENNGNSFLKILKGTAFALAISFLAVVVFACVLRIRALSDKTVYFVNQSIKCGAIILAALVFVRGEKGWIKGGLIGVLFTALSYLTFSIVAHNFSLSASALFELFVGVLAGAVAGAIAVNLKGYN